MFISASDPATAPVGGAELGQVIGLSIAATLVTGVLLVIAWAHRTHRIEWFDRLGSALGRRTGEPGWSTIPTVFVASSLIVALLGFMWDVSLHAGRGRDAGPLANPAHYLILYGLFALFIAGMSAVVYPRDGEKPGIASVRITRHWYAPVSGIFIAACGLYALIGFPLDDVWHRLFGQDVTLWGPTHLMLIGGAGLSTAGIILLNREAEIAMRLKGREVPVWLRTVMVSTAFGSLLIGLSVFQAEFDFGIAQFRLVFAPMMIAAAAGLTLVAARLYVGPGAAIAAVVFFLLMRGIISFVVTDVMGQAHHVFPLYLGSAVLIELLALSRLKDKPLWFGAVGGLLIASVGGVIEKLWNDEVFQFPWPRDIWAEGLAMSVPVGIAAGLCGALFALGLQGRPPAKNVGRVIVTASVLVTALAVANGLHATVPSNASADFALTQVGTAANPEVTAKLTVTPADLVDDNPTWVQITAWQGGGAGVVTDRLRRTGQNTWESTKPVPVGGNWKTLLRVQDGRTLAAVPIFLPADAPLDVGEVPASATFTREFVPEIDILQRERNGDGPAWMWGVANMVVLLCSLGIVLGISVAVSRVARKIEEYEAAESEQTPTLTS
ncbi:hypothetical protein C6I20_12775 [Aeromicrobium sp. A1-2]|uniref:hypothetical protein n=1 Tax=Aeromicrobium sp. A1-2 TaxID=2107713 RepID=UPI000E4F21F3|nr:hypothetical protein [Aeromicrobium sp. A1-2]AXT85968.1 hypothetical protein C6I20_12775 [Aeromicrobium sp. A1-2]